jgi:hypothetical protein
MANENDNRVLNRLGARLITPEEVSKVYGGFLGGSSLPHTTTACTLAMVGSADGDVGECGSIN